MNQATVHPNFFFFRTPLYMAIEEGHIEVSFDLIDHGTDLDIQDKHGR